MVIILVITGKRGDDDIRNDNHDNNVHTNNNKSNQMTKLREW